MIQWTLSLDGLITASSIIVLGGVIWRLSARFTKIEDGLDAVTETAKEMSVAITKIAVQQTRLDQHEKMIDELRHGEGKVVPLRGAYEHPR